MSKMPETIYQTENELRLTIKAQGKEVLVDEECCTCINIILKNDGQIMTSFLGAHNPEIVKQLERAQKAYYKEIKKTLKAKYKATEPCECSPECECGDGCNCTPEHNCGCGGHHHEEKHDCGCGHVDCKCGNDCHCTPENHCGCGGHCNDNKQDKSDKKNIHNDKCCGEKKQSEVKKCKNADRKPCKTSVKSENTTSQKTNVKN